MSNEKQSRDTSNAEIAAQSDENDEGPATNVRGRFEDLPARLREKLSSRREFLSDTAKVGTGAVVLSTAGGVATAQSDEDDTSGDEQGTSQEDSQVDEPESFNAEVLAPHATFPQDVGAAFGVSFEDGTEDSVFVEEPSTILMLKLTWEPGGNTGWHTHPGPVVVNLVEGEVTIVHEEDCSEEMYSGGDAFVDTGKHIEVARNPSESDQAVAYALFFGVPDGEPPTQWVEPRDC
jgi:quercetin dioxygenase-like cupin family protein